MSTSVQTYPLISIHDDATVQEAARLMADCTIGALGVLDEDRRFEGIVTERDLLCFIAEGKDAHETRVRNIFNDLPLIVDGPIEEADALDHMQAASVRHLIVREQDDLRIVSMRDLMTAGMTNHRVPLKIGADS